MRFWRRTPPEADAACSDDTAKRRVIYAQARERLEAVEARADAATEVILSRDARNHWSESIRQMIREAKA